MKNIEVIGNIYPELLKEKINKNCKRKTPQSRVKMNKYHKEMKEISLEIGNCTTCWKPKKPDKFMMCERCRIKARKYSRKSKEKKMKTSNCCGENMDNEEISVCPNCEEPCGIDED